MKNEASRPRILIIEDDLSIQKLYEHLLGDRFDLEVVSKVREALKRGVQKHVDLFLVDIHLQETSTGVDLLNLLRQIPSYRTTPVVACTAYAQTGDREHFLACGFDAYLGKPFTAGQLNATIEAALAGVRQGKEKGSNRVAQELALA